MKTSFSSVSSFANILAVAALCAVASLSTSRAAESREWTQAETGKKISGEFVGKKDEKTIQIKMANGRTYDVPLGSLSQEDRDFVAEQEKAMAGEGEGEAKKGEPGEIPEGEVTVTLSGVHICCNACEKALTGLEGGKFGVDQTVTFEPDKEEGTVTIDATSGKAMQYALEAVVNKGFYGKSDHAALQIEPLEDKGITTPIFTVRNIHICCKGCLRDLEEVLEGVEGIEEHGADVDKTQFLVKGKDLKPHVVLQALREAGFGGMMQ